ncbi:MAG: CoA transferase [Robiginitomaculum sp.]|nr:CoA transferase [Robiginitomaculum sp.]
MTLPLSGITVIEFTHMVMGPAVGAILADLGANVIRIEPIGGDKTRTLTGSGAGYFPMFNRGKQSLCLNLKSEAGKKIALSLLKDADVLVENFRPGAMDKLGFGYDDMHTHNPRLIYASEKGFLSGPYEHRTALDEVTQMMGGLAYMTGPPGRPLRAGASVIDITGGMFGAIAILAALQQRHTTGAGQKVTAALYETTAYLVGQHMAQQSVTGTAAKPMPVRTSAWAIYQIFDTKDDDQVFVGIVSDAQWHTFCDAFTLTDLKNDPDYKTNNDRVENKEKLIPTVAAMFKKHDKPDLMEKLEHIGLPFAPVAKPSDLFDDPHLNAAGGLVDVTLPNGNAAKLPALPIEMNGHRLGTGSDLPKPGADTDRLLKSLGYGKHDIETLKKSGVIG